MLALDRGGALGVVAVRLADSLPAFFFRLHGGIAADRWSRRRLMVGRRSRPLRDARAGRARRALGVAVALGPALEAATSYFAPAYGATIPAVVAVAAARPLFAAAGCATAAVGVAGALLAARFVRDAMPERA